MSTRRSCRAPYPLPRRTPSPPTSNGDAAIKNTPTSVGLPKPVFREEALSFSTKKERQTPRFCAPPRPPAKSCPPISRLTRKRPDFMTSLPRAVTFLESPDGSLTETPVQSNGVYDSNKGSYFEQAFEVEEIIGAGYFGTVVRVKSKKDNRLYAVKFAKEKYKGSSDRIRKLEEVRKHQVLLPHSNCVHFYQSWEENGRLYQQFELCESSLDQLAENKHDLPEPLLWSYLIDLLLGVQHLHDHNLIHMDIKPENIFIGRDGLCKLGDFGLVIDLSKETSPSNFVAGDSKYMASEILEGHFTKAADIFSLGITMLELATDLDLPSGGSLWHQLRNTGAIPSLTSHLSHDMVRVIELMMGKDFHRRPNVKQLLNIPSIRKAGRKRGRELAVKSVVNAVTTACLPFYLFLLFVFRLFMMGPFRYVQRRILCYFQHPNFNTPPTAKINGTKSVNRSLFPDKEDSARSKRHVTFSSDEDETDSLNHSELASPLVKDSSSSPRASGPVASPFDWPTSPIRSPRRAMTEPRRLNNVQAQSTPSGHVRMRQRTLARANIGTPQKKLNFDDAEDLDNSFSGTKGKVSFDIYDKENDSDSSTAQMTPVSLAAKFDYYSEDNSDQE